MWYANPQGKEQQFVPVLYRHIQTGSVPCERRAGHVVPAGDSDRHKCHGHEGVILSDGGRQAGDHSDEDCRCHSTISCLISAFYDFCSLNETERRGLRRCMYIVFHKQGLGGRVIGGHLATVYKCSLGTPGRRLFDVIYLSIRPRKLVMLSPVNILPSGLVTTKYKGHYSMCYLDTCKFATVVCTRDRFDLRCF